jgi:3-hydroxybutyrate dehydrogenase
MPDESEETMETQKTNNLKEPVIAAEDILKVTDPDFNPSHVCLITGVGTGIGP